MSDKEGSYEPLTLRGGMINDSNLVGDGPFFVGRALDTLSTKSRKCAEAIEKVYRSLEPEASADSNSSAAK